MSRHPNSRISIFGDYNYEHNNEDSEVEEQNQEDRPTQKEVPPWDSFRAFPTKRYSGSNQDNRCFNFTILTIKLLTYLLIFFVILLCGFLSKTSMLFAISQLSPRKSFHYCSKELYGQKYSVDVSQEGTVLWCWSIVAMFAVPEVFSVLQALWRWMFKKSQCRPRILSLLVLFLVEALHTFGLALLVFLVLPQLKSMEAAALLCCLCLVPAILALLSQNRGQGLISWKALTLFVLFDLLACSAQVSGLLLSLIRRNTQFSWAFPLSLALSSCRWWGNYVSEYSYLGFIRFLASVKKDLLPSRLVIQGYTSIWRTAIFLGTAISIYAIKGIPVNHFLDVLNDRTYGLNFTRTLNVNSSNTDEFSLYKNEFSNVRKSFVIFGSTRTIFNVFLIQAVSTWLIYQVGKFAYRTHMHRFGFAFPINLVTPGTIILLSIFSMVRKYEPCAFSEFFPNYLSFNESDYENAMNVILDWKNWCWIAWQLSQFWATIHIWRSECERMAMAENIFHTPSYDSLAIDQFITLNKIRHENEATVEEEDFLEGVEDIQVAGSKEVLEMKDRKEGVKTIEEGSRMSKNNCDSKVYACATMWHETKEEMNELIGSILRLDRDQCAMRVTQKYYKVSIEDYYELETHIFFDDAFRCMHGCMSSCGHDENETQVNDYVITLVETVRRNVEALCMHSSPPIKLPTPYGGRLLWVLPGKTRLMVHLKDKSKIRHRKRWSQVMYMYYLLGYRLMGLPVDVERKEQISENTYILTLDGDIDFQPQAVKVLLDLMKKDKDLGAACGRIHPIGRGPMVWFQKFEYAIGHWLQKSTEHTIGCVLCSPGCFSLFRAKTLMQYNVMAKYATKSTEARHYIQYDQGEDRWLCTLILQVGCRVEYSAASDAYTHAPEAFRDFYIQRKRWIPSTVANIFDLLYTAKETREVNNDISWLYVFYQWILIGSTILGPGTIFLMLVGAFVSAFKIDNWTSLLYNFIPISIFVAVCAFCNEKIQLAVAHVITAVYGLVMIIVLVGVMLQIAEDGFFAPSSLLFFLIIGQLIVAGMMHPQEWSCLLCGLVYYVTVPSMYMLLIVFAIFNVHNVTWGTRETKTQGTETQKSEAKDKILESKNETGKIEFSLAGLFRCVFCAGETQDKEEKYLEAINKSINRINVRLDQMESGKMWNEATTQTFEDQKIEASATNFLTSFVHHDFSSSDDDYNDEKVAQNFEKPQNEKPNFLISPYWLQDERMRNGEVDFLSNLEEEFWKGLIEKYLHPIDIDDEKQKKIEEELLILRNEYVFKFFMINALFVLIVFLLQLNKDVIHLEWPLGATYNITYEPVRREVYLTKDYLKLEPIGFVFIIGFIVILMIQFLAMLVHRFDTFSHILASTNLDLCCCKKISYSRKEVVVSRHAESIAKGLQEAVEQETTFPARRNASIAPSRRKTVTDLTRNTFSEQRRPPNLESLFRHKLNEPNTSASTNIPQRILEALQSRRMEYLERNHNGNSIYDNIDGYSSSLYESRHSNGGYRHYEYDNLGFETEACRKQ